MHLVVEERLDELEGPLFLEVLCGTVSARQLGVQSIEFSFFHLRSTATVLRFGCIEAERQAGRWFDLLRTGLALKEVATVTSTDQLLLPLPLSEILSNPEIGIEDQNPGY